MAHIKPIEIIASMSGKVCQHGDTYFATNKQTGRVYTGKLCNPSTAEPTAKQIQVRENFKRRAQNTSAWLEANKPNATRPKGTDLYQKALAAYKATAAQVGVAKSQWDLAKSGAREEEKSAAQKQVQAAQGAVNVVKSLLRETVQVSQVEGEVESVFPKVGELVGLGSPIMSISIMEDLWATFNVREDQLEGMKIGDTFSAFLPAFNQDIELKVTHVKDEGSFAAWKATKANGQYDLKTFEVKAKPTQKFEGLRPGMTLVKK